MRFLAVLMIVGVVAWVGYRYLTVHTLGEPQYTVSEVREGYEIRTYAPFIVAETEVEGGLESALKEGFILLEDYITGDNLTRATVPFKLPIMQHADAPGRHTIQLAMPRDYTVQTIPRPNNPAVRLRLIPARTVAVLQFSWWASPARIDEQKRELVEVLKFDDVDIVGVPLVAFYNESMTVPYEIMVPIRLVER